MSWILYRSEPGRYAVGEHCRGEGRSVGSGDVFNYRGIDVSHHGFGCIFSKAVEKGSHVVLKLADHHMTFEVMWVESHLGIENMYRVGLSSQDRHLNIESIFRQWGLVIDTVGRAS